MFYAFRRRARATLGSALVSRPRKGLAGVVHRFERELRDRAAVLDFRLEALSDQAALEGREILNRPAVCEVAEVLKVVTTR